MIFRYGDKPVEDFKENFKNYPKEQWTATAKINGFRCFVIIDKEREFKDIITGPPNDSGIYLVSRRPKINGGPTQLPVSSDIFKMVQNLNLPDKSVIDTEWGNQRREANFPEKLFLLDIMWLENKWVGDIIYKNRIEVLRNLFKGKEGEFLTYPKTVYDNFLDFYNEMKGVQYVEGIVLKHNMFRIRGNSHNSFENPLMVKIKFRGGSSGQDKEFYEQ